MEVENPNKEYNLLEKNNFFRLLYPNQNYKISLEYKQWKKSIEEKFGKNENGIEIFCKIDNIVIYNENVNNSIICPTCRKTLYICKYCNKIQNRKITKCCFRTKIKENIIEKKAIYKYINNQKNQLEEFYLLFIINFTPFCFLPQIVLIFMDLFYLDLENEEGESYDCLIDKKSNIYKIPIAILFIGYYLSMLIAFSIFFYILFLNIIIISLPFKLYPIKIIIGFIYSIS